MTKPKIPRLWSGSRAGLVHPTSRPNPTHTLYNWLFSSLPVFPQCRPQAYLSLVSKSLLRGPYLLMFKSGFADALQGLQHSFTGQCCVSDLRGHDNQHELGHGSAGLVYLPLTESSENNSPLPTQVQPELPTQAMLGPPAHLCSRRLLLSGTKFPFKFH